MSVLTAEPVWPAESVAIAVNVRVLLQAALAGIVNVCAYGGVVTVPIVVEPSVKRTRLTPMSSAGAAVSVITSPGLAVAGAVRPTVGAASLIGIGAVRIGNWPVSGLPWDPLRYG